MSGVICAPSSLVQLNPYELPCGKGEGEKREQKVTLYLALGKLFEGQPEPAPLKKAKSSGAY